LAKFLAQRNQVPLMDAQRMARHAWGFLGERLAEPDARALADAFTGAGIPATAFPESAAPHLPEPAHAHGARFPGDALEILVGVPPTPQSLAFGDVKVLALASLRRESITTKTVKEDPTMGRRLAGIGMLALGVPIGFGKTKEVQKTVTESEWVVFLDILAEGRGWRAVPAAFDFSGLGDDRAPSAMENLKRLLARLHRAAPGALLNRGARWFLEGRVMSTLGYDDPADFDKECRWLLALSRNR
jgi:hypothetical protein